MGYSFYEHVCTAYAHVDLSVTVYAVQSPAAVYGFVCVSMADFDLTVGGLFRNNATAVRAFLVDYLSPGVVDTLLESTVNLTQVRRRYVTHLCQSLSYVLGFVKI